MPRQGVSALLACCFKYSEKVVCVKIDRHVSIQGRPTSLTEQQLDRTSSLAKTDACAGLYVVMMRGQISQLHKSMVESWQKRQFASCLCLAAASY